MAQAMQFLSFSSPSSCASRPSGCIASVFGHAGVARQHGRGPPAGSALKNVGQRLLLPREADVQQLKIKGGHAMVEPAAGARPGMAMVVRAACTIGEVKEVKTEVQGIYYNVKLSVSASSQVAQWYKTPGQYLELLPTKTAHVDGALFFVSSSTQAVQEGEMEFLIEDVEGSVANELINSKPGDTVVVSTLDSDGFDVSQLQPVQDVDWVFMFASGYGLGPIRAFIETGFQAKERKLAQLFPMFQTNQTPYLDKQPAWEESGVKIGCDTNALGEFDPAKTVILLVATQSEQERIIEFFEGKGVPHDKILTLFDGIPDKNKSYKNKVLGKPNFPPVGKLHVPYVLKL